MGSKPEPCATNRTGQAWLKHLPRLPLKKTHRTHPLHLGTLVRPAPVLYHFLTYKISALPTPHSSHGSASTHRPPLSPCA